MKKGISFIVTVLVLTVNIAHTQEVIAGDSSNREDSKTSISAVIEDNLEDGGEKDKKEIKEDIRRELQRLTKEDKDILHSNLSTKEELTSEESDILEVLVANRTKRLLYTLILIVSGLGLVGYAVTDIEELRGLSLIVAILGVIILMLVEFLKLIV